MGITPTCKYMNRTALFVANRGYALLSSRRELIQKFIDANWKVVIVSEDDSESRMLAKLGAAFEKVSFNRGGISVFDDWRAKRRIRSIAKKWNPSFAHFFHAKPIIIGASTLRSQLGESVRIVNTITGLGNSFEHGKVTTILARFGYKQALSKSDITIFQNTDDQSFFLSNNLIERSKCKLIIGSGVSLHDFKYVDRFNRNPIGPLVVMIGRMLKKKGVNEFVSIAEYVKMRLPEARFVIVGEEEKMHADSVDIGFLHNKSCVEYLGHKSDIVPILEQADLFLFPSYYREGVPRVIMEASATGLPTVAFNVPGVREAVRNNITGYLIEGLNVEQMASKVLHLLRNQSLRLEMGCNANKFAKEKFDKEIIQESYFQVYRNIGIMI